MSSTTHWTSKCGLVTGQVAEACSSPEAALPAGGAGRHHEAAHQGLGYLHLELTPLERRPLPLVAAAAVVGVLVLHCYLLGFARSVRELLVAPGGLRGCAADGEGESWLWLVPTLALGGEWCAGQRAFL